MPTTLMRCKLTQEILLFTADISQKHNNLKVKKAIALRDMFFGATKMKKLVDLSSNSAI